MKKIKAILILSISINLLLGVVIFLLRKEENLVKNIKAPNKTELQRQTENNISLRNNFQSIFYECNDSVYRNIWNYAFEEEPEMAFLISSAYYLVTNDNKIIKDIDISNSQLKEIYHQRINLKHR